MSNRDTSPFVLISADTHAGADLLQYKEYLAGEWHEEFDRWAAAFYDPWTKLSLEMGDTGQGSDGTVSKPGTASFVDDANWDSRKRLNELEREGIVAEVLFPNTVPPFYPSGFITAPGPRTAEEYERRWVGLRAHNRWLADFCADAPGRRAGLAQVFLTDVDDAIAEVRWARDHGLKGVSLPPDHMLQMNSLYYPRLNPLWAACEELGMPVHRHGILVAEAGELGPEDPAPAVGVYESWFYAQRGLAHMLLAGVFDRFPELKFVVSEGQVAWVPKVLRGLDNLCDVAKQENTVASSLAREPLSRLKRKPSESFSTNCYLGTFFSPDDIEARHAVGVDRLMWGSDYPHQEGTYPYTREVLRANFAGLPTEEVRQMVSGTAAEVYGFDLVALQAVADRIAAPTPAEISVPLTPEERPANTLCPSLVESFGRHKTPTVVAAASV